jgi:YggT family protein
MPQLISVIRTVFELYSFILLARVLISWFQVDPYNPLVQLLYRLTEPLLAPIRRILPPAGMLDLSPLVGFVAIRLANELVTSLLLSSVR